MQKGDTVEIVKCDANQHVIGLIGEIILSRGCWHLVRLPKNVDTWDEKEMMYKPPKPGISEVLMLESEIKPHTTQPNTTQPIEFLMTAKQCAKRYKISTKTWTRWLQDGKIPQPRAGAMWILSDLEKWENGE